MHKITDIHAAQRIDDRLHAALDPSNEPWHLPHFQASMSAPQSDASWPPSPRRTACTANACSSGDKACPCPEACQLPESGAFAWVMDCLDRIPVRHFWLGYATFLVALAAGLFLIFN